MATTRKIRRVSKSRSEDGSDNGAVSEESLDGTEAEEMGEVGASGSADLAHRVGDIERRAEELYRRYKQISDDAARAIGKAVQVSDEVETLKNETLENMQVAFDENAEVLESIEKDVTELKNRFGEDQLDKAKAEIDSRISALERTRDSVSAEVKLLKSDGESMRRSVQGLQTQLEQKVVADLERLRQEVQESIRQAEARAVSAAGQTSESTKQLDETVSALQALGAEGASLGAALSGLLKRGSQRTEELELKFLELDEERATVNKREGDLEKSAAALADQVKSLTARLEGELEKARGAYHEVESALNASNGALERTREASRSVEALESRLLQAEGEISSLVGKLHESAAQAASSTDRVNLALKMVEDVEDKIRRLVAPVDDALEVIEDFESVPHDGELGFELNDLLNVMIKHNASDLHLKVGAPPTVRLDGELIPVGNQVLTEADCKRLVFGAISKSMRRRLMEKKDLDFAYSIPNARFRINAFLQRGTVSAAFRMLREEMPSLEELGLPPVLKQLASHNNGLILVTGPAGAGKSTTLASMIDYINTNKKLHVVTVEDPIEFVHKDKLSIITQREVGADTTSFQDALKQALRQDPNVILIGEMRDPETIWTAVMAAETGHLVLSTLHTPNTSQAIDRIIETFSGEQQKQFRMLLANTLRGVVSQRLLNRVDGHGRVPAVEVMVATPTISSLILEGKTNEIYTYLQQGGTEGMQTFTQSLTRLCEAGLITKEEALFHADQPTEFRLNLEGHSTGTTGSYAEGDTLMNWL